MKKHNNYSVRSKSELLAIATTVADYLDLLNEQESNRVDEVRQSWTSLFRGLVKLLNNPAIDDFCAEHAVDAFIHVCNERIRNINESEKPEYKSVVTSAIIELEHGDMIKKYSDLLRDSPRLYPIYFSDEPDCKCIPEYKCSRRGIRLLEEELGRLPEFDKIAPSEIVDIVCNTFEVDKNHVLDDQYKKRLQMAKLAVIYMYLEHTDMSSEEIEAQLGDRDCPSVSAAKIRVKKMKSLVPEYADKMEVLESKLSEILDK